MIYPIILYVIIALTKNHIFATNPARLRSHNASFYFSNLTDRKDQILLTFKWIITYWNVLLPINTYYLVKCFISLELILREVEWKFILA